MIRLSINTEHFVCDSGDVKPTGVNIGSLLIEEDTGICYVSYDGENWGVYLGSGEDLYLSNKMK